MKHSRKLAYFLTCLKLLLVPQQSRVITLCAYRDISGMFTTENKVNCSVKEDTVIRSQSETETIIQDLR